MHVCDKTLKDKLQALQNRSVRDITGAKYIRSEDLLQRLNWDALNVKRAKLKSTLLYKVLNENSAL
jgi:hypothetical protein